MDLTNGTYIIRYVPQGASPDDVGGVYASSKDGPSKPVTVEPLGPEEKIYISFATMATRTVVEGLAVADQQNAR